MNDEQGVFVKLVDRNISSIIVYIGKVDNVKVDLITICINIEKDLEDGDLYFRHVNNLNVDKVDNVKDVYNKTGNFQNSYIVFEKD